MYQCELEMAHEDALDMRKTSEVRRMLMGTVEMKACPFLWT